MATTSLNLTTATGGPLQLEVNQVHANSRFNHQEGFSILEMVIATAVMLTTIAFIASMVKSSLTISTTNYEMTDAQESLRTAHEYINRDLLNAGDGLKSITYLPVNTTFMTTYLTVSPISDPAAPANAKNLGMVTTDNNATSGMTIPAPWPGPSPLPTATPIPLLAGSDRQTILEIDPDLATNPQIFPASITFSTSGDVITLPLTTTTADMAKFNVGDIYFLTSIRGGTFVAITTIDAGNKKLKFETGDPCGLNSPGGTNDRIKDISSNGSLPTVLQRMRIIQYFVDANRILKRRVFGERGTPYRDSIIAEHVMGVQFIYSLGLDSNGNPVQPTNLLTTPEQQVNISQVQVQVTVETPHALTMNQRPTISSTSSTSLRNMQFRQALQPKPSPTP